MDIDIDLADILGRHNFPIQQTLVVIRHILAGKFATYGAVDDDVRDMNALRTKLARERSRNSAEPVLGARKCDVSRACTNASGRAGKDDRTASSRGHYLRCLARGKEARKAGHFPNLAENAS